MMRIFGQSRPTPRFDDLLAAFSKQRLNHVMHVSRRFNYVYVSNPKAACTTIKHYLVQAELGNPESHPRHIHQRRNVPLLMPRQLTPEEREGIVSGSFFLFTFVRHPLKRAVSAYADKILGNKKQKAEILEILGHDPEVLDREVSFEEFMTAITSQPPRKLNPHWRPQVLNLAPNALNYDFVGRVENLTDDMRAVCEKLGLPEYRIRKRNAKSHKVDVDLNSLITARAHDLATNLYEDDYRTFGYSMEDLSHTAAPVDA
jgi:hypothetical protein